MAKTNVEQVSYADLAETTIEKIPAPEYSFDEQEIVQEQEIDQRRSRAHGVSARRRYGRRLFRRLDSRRYSRTFGFVAQARRTGSLYRMAAQNCC